MSVGGDLDKRRLGQKRAYLVIGLLGPFHERIALSVNSGKNTPPHHVIYYPSVDSRIKFDVIKHLTRYTACIGRSKPSAHQKTGFFSPANYHIMHSDKITKFPNKSKGTQLSGEHSANTQGGTIRQATAAYSGTVYVQDLPLLYSTYLIK